MAILHLVELRSLYLIMRHFQINTNHHNLKYLIQQIFSLPKQHRWVTKMILYHYDILYNKGRENVVVDALNRGFYEESVRISNPPLSNIVYLSLFPNLGFHLSPYQCFGATSSINATDGNPQCLRATLSATSSLHELFMVGKKLW